jgi:hypothetical protein
MAVADKDGDRQVKPETVTVQQLAESVVVLLLGILSLAALLWYYTHNELLLYGDAVAHINIARRVIDNRSWLSSFFQLGTVWLPLQHVAMLPFVWNNRLWQTGIAGSIPSMIAYVLGGVGVFRLVSGFTPTLRPTEGDLVGAPASPPTLRQRQAQNGAPTSLLLPACVATAIYAFNPNLLYMQTTAMNEPIYIAFFTWALVYLEELLNATGRFATGEGPRELTGERALERCGICLAGAAWTRYDGWFTGVVIGVILVFVVVRWWHRQTEASRRRALTKSLIEVLLLNALIPVFWLAYNHRVSGRAMDWANGPYSAKAIAERTTERGAAPYPGKDHPATAALYFLKAAQLNMGSSSWGRALLALALLGTAVAFWRFGQYKVWLLLWLPLVFYALSIAYGSVPIFIPTWWPFSYYNVRYGLELLPVFAAFPVVLGMFVAERLPNRRREWTVWALLAACLLGSYLTAWDNMPITLREAQANSRTRLAMEDALANFLSRIPKNATILMYQGSHVGALQRAGIPLKHVISEVSHPDWEWALLDPAHKAGYIIAFKGDPVWAAAKEHPSELKEVMAITVPGQEQCRIYVPTAPPASLQTP